MKKIMTICAAICATAASAAVGVVTLDSAPKSISGCCEVAGVKVVGATATDSVTVKEVVTGYTAYTNGTAKTYTPTNWTETVVTGIDTNVYAAVTNSIPSLTNLVYTLTNTSISVTDITTNKWGGVETNNYNIVKEWYAPKYIVTPATNWVVPAYTEIKTNWADVAKSAIITNTVTVKMRAGTAVATNTLGTVTCTNSYGEAAFTGKYSTGGKWFYTGSDGAKVELIILK